jgi:hypothetical protein
MPTAVRDQTASAVSTVSSFSKFAFYLPMASAAEIGETSTFTFSSMPAPKLASDVRSSLEKWDMSQTSFLARFRFDELFQPGTREAAAFVTDLFNSPAFTEGGGKVCIRDHVHPHD